MVENKKPPKKIWKAIIFIMILNQILQAITLCKLKHDVMKFQENQVKFNVNVIQFHQEQLEYQEMTQEILDRLVQNDSDICQIIDFLSQQDN